MRHAFLNSTVPPVCLQWRQQSSAEDWKITLSKVWILLTGAKQLQFGENLP